MPRLVLPAGAHGEGCWAGSCCDGGAPCPACCSWQGLPSHDGVGVQDGLLTAPGDRWPLCIQVLLTCAQQRSGHTLSISPTTTFTSASPYPPGNCLKLPQPPSQVQMAIQLCTCSTHTPTCPQGAHSAHPQPGELACCAETPQPEPAVPAQQGRGQDGSGWHCAARGSSLTPGCAFTVGGH